MDRSESSRLLRIHFHSDCSFFAGCENMLANFFNSEEFRRTFELSFSYRWTVSYYQGLSRRVRGALPTFEFSFPDLSELDGLPADWPHLLKRTIMATLRCVLLLPLLGYEISVFYRLFRRIKPDVLHINNGGYPGALSARAAALAGWLACIPMIIMVVNNLAVDYRRFSRWFDYPIDRLVGWAVDHFVTGSRAASKRLGIVMNLSQDKLIAINNGIALRERTESAQQTWQRLGLGNNPGVVIGVVALLVPRKGHLILLDALAQIVKNGECPHLILLIEGSGPLLGELKAYIHNQGLAEWVRLVGNEENVVDFIGCLDIMVLPSTSDEDFPNVILEAMAMAKPVISTRLAGIPEQIIDGETGLLVEPGNSAQLAKAIKQLCIDIDIRERMGRSGLARYLTNFTDAVALQEYSKLYLRHFRTEL